MYENCKVIDKNKSRILNKSEQKVLEHITNSDCLSRSNVFPKIRVADVFPITNSGIKRELYSYALKAHFDFLICCDNYYPEFAIEFNGPSHLDPKQKIRDLMKVELCEKFGLPLGKTLFR